VVLEPQGSSAIFADTSAPGLYRVDLRREGETIRTEQFVVNLFDPAESAIEPQESITIGTTTIPRGAREETARREYWPWIAAIGLAILLIEWLVYHRSLRRLPRVTLPGSGRPLRDRVASLRRSNRTRAPLRATRREERGL